MYIHILWSDHVSTQVMNQKHKLYCICYSSSNHFWLEKKRAMAMMLLIARRNPGKSMPRTQTVQQPIVACELFTLRNPRILLRKLVSNWWPELCYCTPLQYKLISLYIYIIKKYYVVFESYESDANKYIHLNMRCVSFNHQIPDIPTTARCATPVREYTCFR